MMRDNRSRPLPDNFALVDKLERDAAIMDDICKQLCELSREIAHLRLTMVLIIPAIVIFGVPTIAAFFLK